VLLRAIALVSLAVAAIACRAASPPPAREEAVWLKMGSWSGHGDKQTDSFDGETGAFRITWNAVGAPPQAPGTLRITLHSAVSGRPLSVAVDQQGAGGGTTYVNEDPRTFFFVVESKNLDWSFSADEQVTVAMPEGAQPHPGPAGPATEKH